MDVSEGLSETQRVAIDQHFIRGVSSSPLLPPSALSEFLLEKNQSDLSSVVQIEFANRKRFFETVGSEMTETDLYLAVWKDTLFSLLRAVSFIWSMDFASSTLLVSHWHGVTCLAPLHAVESLNFAGCVEVVESHPVPNANAGALLSLSNTLSCKLPFFSPLQWIEATSPIFDSISGDSLLLENSVLSELTEEDVFEGLDSLLQALSCDHIETLRLLDREMPMLPIPAESLLYKQIVYFSALCRFRFGVPLLYLLSALTHQFTHKTNELTQRMERLVAEMARCAGFLSLFDRQLLLSLQSELSTPFENPPISKVFGSFYAILDSTFHTERMQGDAQQWEAFLSDRFTASISVLSIPRFHLELRRVPSETPVCRLRRCAARAVDPLLPNRKDPRGNPACLCAGVSPVRWHMERRRNSNRRHSVGDKQHGGISFCVPMRVFVAIVRLGGALVPPLSAIRTERHRFPLNRGNVETR